MKATEQYKLYQFRFGVIKPIVKCSFSAGFCHLWFGGFAQLSLNKAMCLNAAGGVF